MGGLHASNRRAEETARRTDSPDDALHAIDYQVCAALQLGRDTEAKRAIERGDWKMAAALEPRPSKFPYADAMTHFARAVGAARLGDVESARNDATRLAAQAWIELSQGSRDAALSTLRRSADLQDAAEKASVTPGHLAPSRELLGEMLLELGQPAQALKEFEASELENPKRLRTARGAALAAARLGK